MDSEMAHRAICYTCTEDYLFPTLLSAIQARANCAWELADVLIFNIGAQSPITELIARVAESYQLALHCVAPGVLEGMHVMFARLFLDRFLSEDYSQVLYLDGDTQVQGSLEQLLLADPEYLIATRDPMTLMENADNAVGERIRANWDRAGIRTAERSSYFNSGMLRINRNTWDSPARECMRMYQDDPGSYLYPDQDVLNKVFAGRSNLVSFKWNFPAFLLPYEYRRSLDLRMVHFMSNPRPWHGPFFPWGRAFYQQYLRLAKLHPELARLRPQLSGPRYAKYVLQQAYKASTDRLVWATRGALRTFEGIEQRVLF
jgi:lipopolysaccharide biosynthesis glycosyltransferase